jgi:hypothetical protein
MKYLTRYPKPLLENDDEDDSDLLLDFEALGLLKPEQMAESRRAKFIQSLVDLFSRVGIEWRDTASSQSRSRGTQVPRLTEEEAYQLVMSAAPDIIQSLSRNRATKLTRIHQEISSLGDWTRPDNPLTYWIQPAGVRTQYYGRFSPTTPKPTVSSFIKFNGELTPKEMIALFVNQVAIDLSPRLIHRSQR